MNTLFQLNNQLNEKENRIIYYITKYKNIITFIKNFKV